MPYETHSKPAGNVSPDGRELSGITHLLKSQFIPTRHPGSKRGYVHTPREGGGNVHRAVTRARRMSWNHLGKFPRPMWTLYRSQTPTMKMSGR